MKWVVLEWQTRDDAIIILRHFLGLNWSASTKIVPTHVNCYLEESDRKNESRTPCVSKMAIALYQKRLYKCRFQFEL